MAKKSQYINPSEYNDELVKCVKQDKLSAKMIEMFSIHAKNVCRRFYFPDDDDKNDAVSTCMVDFLHNWKSFAVQNNVFLKFNRNFQIGEKLELIIENYGTFVFTAGEHLDKETMTFEIRDTANKSIRSLMILCQDKPLSDIIRVTNNTSNHKMMIRDLHNQEDLTVFSKLIVHELPNEQPLILEDGYYNIIGENVYSFVPFSPAFQFLTSLCNNSIKKSLDYTSPKALRGGNQVRLSCNAEDNGIYTL